MKIFRAVWQEMISRLSQQDFSILASHTGHFQISVLESCLHFDTSYHSCLEAEPFKHKEVSKKLSTLCQHFYTSRHLLLYLEHGILKAVLHTRTSGNRRFLAKKSFQSSILSPL